jgi:hypothetical protein
MQSQHFGLLTSTKTVEWYTNKESICLVKKFFARDGRELDSAIDLDPASSELPQYGWIKAKNWFGLEHPDLSCRDGLLNDWTASSEKIFCNPPYNGNTRHWLTKAHAEYDKYLKHYTEDWLDTEIIFLISSSIGYNWFEDLLDRQTTCLVRKRLSFIKEDGTQGGQAKKASAFVYWGKNNEEFAEHFKHLGRIIVPIR